MAGLLDLGEEALVGGRAAAALHRFDGFTEGPLEFLVPRELKDRRSLGVVRSTNALPLIDRCTREGCFRATSPAATIVRLAAHVTEAELKRAVDSAIRDGGTSEPFSSSPLRRPAWTRASWRSTPRRGPGWRGRPLVLGTSAPGARGAGEAAEAEDASDLPAGRPSCCAGRLRLAAGTAHRRGQWAPHAQHSITTAARRTAPDRADRARAQGRGLHIRRRRRSAGLGDRPAPAAPRAGRLVSCVGIWSDLRPNGRHRR
jgi:hypothetical protein